MSDSVERVWNRAVQLGLANREMIELAHAHCVSMNFVRRGSGGAVEADTGLPVGMREIRCPVALGGVASNLQHIVFDFYREHCIGCELRRPSGQLPTLANVVAEADANATAAIDRERQQVADSKAAWAARDEQRRVLAVNCDDAMLGALTDIGAIDGNPEAPIDAPAKAAALARLAALADRQPQLFHINVVDYMVELVRTTDVADELLDPLRRLALARPELVAPVVHLAADTLRLRSATAAGQCMAELEATIPADLIDERVCRSLVRLAGRPAFDRMGRPMLSNKANDPTGLRAAAAIAPEVVTRTLRNMLPPPAVQSGLVLPVTAASSPAVSSVDRAAAAGAVRALAASHSELAAALVDALVLDLGVMTEDDTYDPARVTIEHTLAVLFVLDVGDVIASVSRVGRQCGEELRRRLFNAVSRAEDMIEAEPRWREPGDPVPDADRRVEVANALFAFAIGRLGGDWGGHVQTEAADVVKDLVVRDPGAALPRVPALLGEVLRLADPGRNPAPSALALPATEEAQWARAFEAEGRRMSDSATVSRVLGAVETVAGADAAAVCSAVVELIADERDTERGSGIIWSLLRMLGRIGSRHGDEPRVLRSILPVLHSYLVDTKVELRAAAIDAWTEIGSSYPLPASLRDLLPVLAADRHLLVAQALTRAARRLDWSESDRAELLQHALIFLGAVDPANHSDVVKSALATVVHLSQDADEPVRSGVEQLVLKVASGFDNFELRDVLSRNWLPITARSSMMARLRLRQAADPVIVDRWNVHDDEELRALLACGPGLVDLPVLDLTAVALVLTPEFPLGSIEFAEVAWRAGRADDVVSIIDAVADATPDNQAYAGHRLILDLIRAAAEVDAAAFAGRNWTDAATRASAAASALAEASGSEDAGLLAASVKAAVAVRKVLAANEQRGDPSQVRRQHAEALGAAGAELEEASKQATDTGAYLRVFAGTCVVGAHLLHADAAAFDADRDAMRDHAVAASRRAEIMVSELAERFADVDPLAGPLRRLLVEVIDMAPGVPAGPILAGLARLPMPVPVVRGPRRRVRRASAGAEGNARREEPTATPVAVVLASIDDQLVTGPQVLRYARIYNLRVDVQVDSWPEWADQLDCELLTHLKRDEITTPEFTWARGEHGDDEDTYRQTGSLVVRFSIGAGQPLPPLLVRLAWPGEVSVMDSGSPRCWTWLGIVSCESGRSTTPAIAPLTTRSSTNACWPSTPSLPGSATTMTSFRRSAVC